MRWQATDVLLKCQKRKLHRNVCVMAHGKAKQFRTDPEGGRSSSGLLTAG